MDESYVNQLLDQVRDAESQLRQDLATLTPAERTALVKRLCTQVFECYGTDEHFMFTALLQVLEVLSDLHDASTRNG